MNYLFDRVIENENIIDNLLSSRSVLYNLEPKGMGTPLVESLTSYISRLAYIHNVKISTLFQEFVPYMEKAYLTEDARRCIDKSIAKYINGFGSISNDFVKAVENLTCRNDIQFLTMNNWTGIFMGNIVSKHRKWCPACLNQMKLESKVIYEPLIWNISDITKCEIHGIRLEEECPDCHKKLPPLHSNLIVGYCQYCRGWLGDRKVKYKEELLSEEEKLINTNYQQLIANAPILSMFPTKNNIGYVLKNIMEGLGFKSITKFSNFLEVEKSKLSNWINRMNLPSGQGLLNIACKMNSTIYEMFCEQKLNLNIDISQFNNDGKTRKVTKDEIKNYLLDAIKSDEPKGLKQVADEGGFTDRTAENYFPSLCKIVKENFVAYKKQLLQKKKEEIEEMLKECLTREIPISLTALSKEYGVPIITAKRYAPELSEKVIKKNKEFKVNKQMERREKISKEIEKIIFDLHSKGMYPSIYNVKKRLSNPNVLRESIFTDHYRTILISLGYENNGI